MHTLSKPVGVRLIDLLSVVLQFMALSLPQIIKKIPKRATYSQYTQAIFTLSTYLTTMQIILALTAYALFESTAIAAVRCTDSNGATAYVDSAIACPTGYKATGQVGAMPAVNATDYSQAKAQATNDKRNVDALEAQRLRGEQANAKAQLNAQKNSASKAKSCKTAELALKRAQDKYDDAPNAVHKNAKTNKPANNKASGQANKNASKNQTHTVQREGDEKSSKAKRKARHALEQAQAKRDLACS